MAACVPAAADRERAVKEVAQAYEHIKVQQPLLLLHHHCSGEHQLLAHSLLGEAMRALDVALSVMKQQPALAQPPSPRPDDHYKATVATAARRGSKRQRSSSVVIMEAEGKNKKSSSSSSWVSLTTMPYDDGYVWRKYGEKTINGTSYTRSYFRCTYKYDTGCQATKHVQQQQQQAGGNHTTDPPMFQVTYNNRHTCNNSSRSQTAAMPPLIQVPDDVDQTPPPLSSSQEPLFPPVSMQQFCTGTSMDINPLPPPSDGHAAAMGNIDHRETPVAVLPPVPEASSSALVPFDQTPLCQQEPLFPICMQRFCDTVLVEHCHHGGGDDTAPLLAPTTCMEVAEASPADDPFYDLELFLLSDSDY